MAGKLDSRVTVRDNGDELDRLAANLNAMLDRIQSLMESLKQVSSDIAHDLRTPLARLRQNLETAERMRGQSRNFAPRPTPPSQRRKGCSRRSPRSFASHRSSPAHVRQASRAVDLSELFELVALTFAAVAEDQGHRLVSDIEVGVTISGDRELLLQLATNLVENAIRHTPSGTKIEFRLQEERPPSSSPPWRRWSRHPITRNVARFFAAFIVWKPAARPQEADLVSP